MTPIPASDRTADHTNSIPELKRFRVTADFKDERGKLLFHKTPLWEGGAVGVSDAISRVQAPLKELIMQDLRVDSVAVMVTSRDGDAVMVTEYAEDFRIAPGASAVGSSTLQHDGIETKLTEAQAKAAMEEWRRRFGKDLLDVVKKDAPANVPADSGIVLLDGDPAAGGGAAEDEAFRKDGVQVPGRDNMGDSGPEVARAGGGAAIDWGFQTGGLVGGQPPWGVRNYPGGIYDPGRGAPSVAGVVGEDESPLGGVTDAVKDFQGTPGANNTAVHQNHNNARASQAGTDLGGAADADDFRIPSAQEAASFDGVRDSAVRGRNDGIRADHLLRLTDDTNILREILRAAKHYESQTGESPKSFILSRNLYERMVAALPPDLKSFEGEITSIGGMDVIIQNGLDPGWIWSSHAAKVTFLWIPRKPRTTSEQQAMFNRLFLAKNRLIQGWTKGTTNEHEKNVSAT